MKLCLGRSCFAWSLVAAWGVIAAAGCGSAAMTVTPPVVTTDTRVRAGDSFEVRVWGEPELSGVFRVAAEGTVDFPLVGRIQVADREPTEIVDLLSAALKENQILTNPQVSVLVREYASRRVSVVGAVAKPGEYPIIGDLTVLQAISMAGGFTPLASRNSTIVTRNANGEVMRLSVPVQSIAEGLSQDVALQAGDIVYVPERVF